MKNLDRSRFAEKIGWTSGATRRLSGAGILADAMGVGAGSKSGVERPAVAAAMVIKSREVEYGVHGISRPCVERYFALAGIKEEQLRDVSAPGLEASSFLPEHGGGRDEQAPRVAKLVMKLMCRRGVFMG